MYELKIDEELRDLLPPLTPDEYEKLEKSILKNSLQDNIKIWTDSKTGISYIVDGHNRYGICKKNNINIEHKVTILDNTKYATKDDIIEYMITYQLGRRNLSEYDRFQIIQKYKPLLEKKAKQNMAQGLSTLSKVNVRKEMAEKIGVSEGTYAKLDKIDKSDNEELKKKVKNKEVSINKAYKEIVEPKIPSEKMETTDDIDNKLKNLDDEIAGIKREKEKMFVIRQKIFQEAPDEIKCEVEIVEKKKSYGDCIYINFYLVKGENKVKVIDELLSSYYEKPIDETLEEIERILRFGFINYTRKTEKEKNIIIAKFYETRDEILKRIKEIEDIESKEREEYYQNLLNSAIDTQIEPLAQEIVSAGYKTLAKKYHPDVTKDDGIKMKELNKAKEQLLQRI